MQKVVCVCERIIGRDTTRGLGGGADDLFDKLGVRKSTALSMNPRPLRTWVTGAAVILGGIATLNLASTVTLKALHFASEKKRVRIFAKLHFCIALSYSFLEIRLTCCGFCFVCRKKLPCLVGHVEGKGSIYANCATGMPP